ncbi:unnamed protein product [Paramecium octaurelia]|uniref:Fatty acid hydroxylase domain-containing protein n=1 Tax=Paramecium octaurelia TaxID=43137 RepID=A0A8S1X7Q9_PAROT|nr:unnamed protein product [Paramecium octaurelia]
MIYKLIGISGYLIYLIYFTKFLEFIWPNEIQNKNIFFIVVMVVVQNVIQVVVCAYYQIFYSLNHPFFEQYKLVKKPWPWEKNKEEWKKMKIKTLKSIILNQSLAALLVSVIPPFQCRMDTLSFPSYLEIMKHVIICHLSEDFIFYWSHRILHLPKLYPKIHKVHHQYNVSIAIATEYAHPIEFISSNIIPIFSGPYLLGDRIHCITILIYVGLHLSKAIHQHCGYVFPWELYNYLPFATNSIHHGLHHSENNGNYGSQFILFDKLFGTCIEYKVK